ncbi:hypothetical protein [Chitinimonas naiadis]
MPRIHLKATEEIEDYVLEQRRHDRRTAPGEVGEDWRWANQLLNTSDRRAAPRRLSDVKKRSSH